MMFGNSIFVVALCCCVVFAAPNPAATADNSEFGSKLEVSAAHRSEIHVSPNDYSGQGHDVHRSRHSIHVHKGQDQHGDAGIYRSTILQRPINNPRSSGILNPKPVDSYGKSLHPIVHVQPQYFGSVEEDGFSGEYSHSVNFGTNQYAPGYKDYYAYPKYNFGYGVRDDYHGTNFGHHESRDGDVTRGEYYVHLPDGRIQRVSYYADKTGYHPTITYINPGHYIHSSEYDR